MKNVERWQIGVARVLGGEGRAEAGSILAALLRIETKLDALRAELHARRQRRRPRPAPDRD